jgi:hypothetical protein
MKSRVVLLSIIASVISAPVGAQWLDYPTPSIPRAADGKPNLTAPAPHTADGKPDLSGLWNKISPTYSRNIAVDLTAGDVQPWAQALLQKRMEDLGKDYMNVHCLPLGPGYTTASGGSSEGMVKIVQTPALIIMLNPDLTYHQVFMDGRPLEANPNPSWMGYSVGHWDGDTLVVESFGFNDKTWLDRDGHPHTEALRTTERYHRRDFGHLDIDVTLKDPGAYAKPWTVKVQAELAADTELLEYVCNEDAQSIVEHWVGKASDEKKGEVKIAPEILAKYAGLYQELDFWPGHGPHPRMIEITVSGDALFAEVKGRGKIQLSAASATVFSGFYGFSIEFVPDAQGVPTQLIERHVSSEYRFTRTK